MTTCRYHPHKPLVEDPESGAQICVACRQDVHQSFLRGTLKLSPAVNKVLRDSEPEEPQRAV